MNIGDMASVLDISQQCKMAYLGKFEKLACSGIKICHVKTRLQKLDGWYEAFALNAILIQIVGVAATQGFRTMVYLNIRIRCLL